MHKNTIPFRNIIESFHKKHNTEEFRKLHGFDHYDYSLITEENYKGARHKIPVICNIHNFTFDITGIEHRIGTGCSKCAIDYRANLKRKSIETFLLRSKRKHGNKYDYSKVVYFRGDESVCIICPKHGEFWQCPEVHYRSGCNECGQEIASNKTRMSQDEFIKRSIKVHGEGTFDYSKVIYKNYNENVILICCKCKLEFECSPSNNLQKKGCRYCNNNYSSGNKLLYEILKTHELDFKDEFRINECKYKRPLPFDFVIFDKFKNIKCLIEFDGKYHFEPIRETTRHNKKSYEIIKIRDNIKTQYCIDNNIKLIRISYLDRDNMEEILKKEFII